MSTIYIYILNRRIDHNITKFICKCLYIFRRHIVIIFWNVSSNKFEIFCIKFYLIIIIIYIIILILTNFGGFGSDRDICRYWWIQLDNYFLDRYLIFFALRCMQLRSQGSQYLQNPSYEELTRLIRFNIKAKRQDRMAGRVNQFGFHGGSRPRRWRCYCSTRSCCCWTKTTCISWSCVTKRLCCTLTCNYSTTSTSGWEPEPAPAQGYSRRATYSFRELSKSRSYCPTSSATRLRNQASDHCSCQEESIPWGCL